MATPDDQDIDNPQDRHVPGGDSQDHGAGHSIVPSIVNEFGDDLHPVGRSKEITLRRLPPNDSWEDIVFGEPRMYEDVSASRRPSLVSIILIAAFIGALSGAGTTWGVGYFGKGDKVKASAEAAQERSVNDAIAQVSSELQTLKSSAESAAKNNASKLARLSETIDKMKTASPADITGSISSSAAKTAVPTPAVRPVPVPTVAAPASAPAFGRLPTLDGWTLREVTDGGALIEGRLGVFEVYPGVPLPGVGRVNAIRRQDGRWVVVTERGLITTR